MMNRNGFSAHAIPTVFALLVLSAAFCTGTAFAKPSGGGKPPPTTTFRPMTLDAESYFFRVTGEDQCVGEDDKLTWSASGSLAPGESFSFTPALAGCAGHPAAISVVATWNGGVLDLSSTVPDADLASLDAEQAGRVIHAPVVNQRAQLCMFPAYNSNGVDYTITVTNHTSETVHEIVLQGESRNDWSIHYYPRCLNADADGDGWNDSFEHSITNLLYPNSYIDGIFQPDILWGSNYLRGKPETPYVQDEIDSYPPDFNDDGRVDEADLLIIDDWTGQGNGISLEEISPDPGEFGYHSNTLPWRRYDLDADGYVGVEDRRIVTQLLGQDVPMAQDVVSPTARVKAPLDGMTVPRGEYVLIESHAWDNSALVRVDYLVNDKIICSQTDPLPGFGFTSPFFFCWWEVPKRSMTHQIEVRAHDASGNVTSSPVIEVLSY